MREHRETRDAKHTNWNSRADSNGLLKLLLNRPSCLPVHRHLERQLEQEREQQPDDALTEESFQDDPDRRVSLHSGAGRDFHELVSVSIDADDVANSEGRW